MSQPHATTQPSIAERELELALREAELNRREAAVRRAELDRELPEPPVSNRHAELELDLAARVAGVERRERELARTVEAVEAQRQRLEDVRVEYETRRDALSQRTREVEAELTRLREEQARLASAAIVEAPVESEPPATRVVEADPVPKTRDALKEPAPPAPPGPPTIDDWWAKQLGSPLEAA